MKLRAFTLLEVVVVVGLLGVTVTAMMALQGSLNRSSAEAAGYDRAGRLVDAVTAELRRLRDQPGSNGLAGGIDALAARIPANTDLAAMKLVADRDSTRVVLESDADDQASGILPGARYYLIEVRQMPPPLGFTPDSGYLAVSVLVKWPYQLPAGPDLARALAADPAAASVAVFHAALTP